MAIRCVALSGGVGGARLSDGLGRALGPDLSVVVNTADDFDLFGLRICPDLDTVLYTLSGRCHEGQGWGLAEETFRAFEALEGLGGPTWFRLGDRDLATHLRRTMRLAEGARLTDVAAELATSMGVAARVLPMCDEPVRTRVSTPAGTLDFQDWFVRRRQEDPVLGVEFAGAAAARPTAEVRQALARADLLVICPSNPFVSVAPILELPGFREAWRASPARKLAVSPIVGGRALKGPAAAMLASLGHEVSALGVARLYADLVDVFVLDEEDADLEGAVAGLGLEPLVAPTVMRGPEGRRALGERLLRCR